MTINILTLFPNFFSSPLAESMIKRAIDADLVTINVVNIRDFTTDKHHVTDERPFGGGPGMVMKVEPIDLALKSLKLSDDKFISQVLLTSAKGKLFTQQLALDYANLQEITIICGHYEGVDQRVADYLADDEIRIGDYVMTGGESAALVITDVVTRLIPGVLGNEMSNQNESHHQPGVMGYPQYTRPENYQGWSVPPVLLTGDHKKITAWREENRG